MGVILAMGSTPWTLRPVSGFRFFPDDAGTRIEFDIDFEFKSRLLDGLLRANFHHAVDRLMSCFEDRARVLYGAPTIG